MHLRVVEETGLFTADEMLYPTNYQYLIDVLAYIAVGARSVENQGGIVWWPPVCRCPWA